MKNQRKLSTSQAKFYCTITHQSGLKVVMFPQSMMGRSACITSVFARVGLNETYLLVNGLWEELRIHEEDICAIGHEDTNSWLMRKN